MSFLTKIFGTKSDREIKKISPIVKEINLIYDSLEGKNEDYLVQRTKELQNKVVEKISEKKFINIFNNLTIFVENKKENGF